jgi:predicted RNA-binding protein with PUA-like domain
MQNLLRTCDDGRAEARPDRSDLRNLWLVPHPSNPRKSVARPAIDCVLSMQMSQYWLVKQEPTTYSWEQFVSDGKTEWTGVRNFQARNNLRTMKVGDRVFYYHSVNGKAIVGIAKVTKEAFRDPTATEGDWSAVELVPLQQIKPPVTLAQIRNEPQLAKMALLKNSRLSVIPVTRLEFETIQEIVNRDHS